MEIYDRIKFDTDLRFFYREVKNTKTNQFLTLNLHADVVKIIKTPVSSIKTFDNITL